MTYTETCPVDERGDRFEMSAREIDWDYAPEEPDYDALMDARAEARADQAMDRMQDRYEAELDFRGERD